MSVTKSDKAVEALKAAGAKDNLKYTRYAAGVAPPLVFRVPFTFGLVSKNITGHSCWELAFKEPSLWEWLAAQRT